MCIRDSGAADLGVDAVILADIGLLDYASKRHPDLCLHLSVQGSATSYEAVNFAHREFGVKRAVLPRVLTPVSFTHLDVYKRQSPKSRSSHVRRTVVHTT